MSLDFELLKDWAEAVKKKRELSSQLDQISKQISQVEPALIDGMSEAGIDRLHFADLNVTISLGAIYAPTVIDEEALHDYLRKNGYKDLVKTSVHHSSLRKTVKDWDEEYIEDNADTPMVESIDQDGVPTGSYVPQDVSNFIISRTLPRLNMKSG